MPDDLDLARGWFQKADSDLTAAKLVLASGGPYDTARFHAQQPAEKYLEGLLVSVGQPFPRTHDLEELQRLGEAATSAWPLRAVDLAELSSYAVQIRYDFEFWPDHATALQASELAHEVRRRVLGYVAERARP